MTAPTSGGLQPPPVSVVETRDGSRTFYHRDLEVHYRSCFGADTESRHVFLEGSRLRERASSWRVLELGFGGGNNFLHTAQAAQECGVALCFSSIDWAPVQPEALASLHASLRPSMRPFSALAQAVLAEVHATGQAVSRRHPKAPIELCLYPSSWELAALPEGWDADAVFHDPFGPRVNPEGWTLDCFAWMKARTAPHGILATYSAASHVRAALAGAGFWLATASGPGKKREITLASPSEAPLAVYKRLSQQRYQKKAAALQQAEQLPEDP